MMIEIEKTEVVGFEHAIRGMRNPMNSWDKSDSYYGMPEPMPTVTHVPYIVGKNDLNLMNRLSSAGTDHGKFLRMIVVYADITAPLYWWKEFDTYKVGTVRNSCSTMHKIHSKEFTMDDFSYEHLSDEQFGINGIITIRSRDILQSTIKSLNYWRERYLVACRIREETGLDPKDIWWQMIQLLPSSYNQKSTVMLNYQVLKNMYHSRKNHKLDEWHKFCDWVKSLPYSEIITGE